MRPIGEASDDCRDYGDYVNGVVSEEFNRFVNYNYVDDSDIIEDDYIAIEYAKYFVEKRKYEDELRRKHQEEHMKKDQTLCMKALGLLGL